MKFSGILSFLLVFMGADLRSGQVIFLPGADSALGELRGVNAEFSETELRLRSVDTGKQLYSWVTIPAASGTWDLSKFETVEARITNRGSRATDTMFWAVGQRGWSGVGDFATLQPSESRRFAIDLRQNYPDGTPKTDPSQIRQLQIMFRNAGADLEVSVSKIEAKGEAPKWKKPQGRIEIPGLENGEPRPGKRVRYQLVEDADSEIYSVLYLPPNWVEGGSYPVVVEFPGNIFFNQKCYSTGRPEQCAIGYGMTKGEGAIILSLPFVDRERGVIVENGFGNPDDTTAHALAAVETVIRDFGGDRNNLFVTGFSRGSIACGFIGLRNEKIGSLWKGMHGCQHYDGSKWKQSDIPGAVLRASRFRGESIFQTDNSREKYQPVVDATRAEVEWIWEKSGLGFHATSMFLDDRASTKRLREWFRKLSSTN